MKQLAILSVLVLTGCQSSSPYEQLPPDVKVLQRAQFAQNCVSLGLVPDTIPFNECIKQSIDAFNEPAGPVKIQKQREIGTGVLGKS